MSAINDGHERVELAERRSGGISIGPYWSRAMDLVFVTLDDRATGDAFELVVASNERPLDVFHHPFVYAHARGIELMITAGERRGRHRSAPYPSNSADALDAVGQADPRMPPVLPNRDMRRGEVRVGERTDRHGDALRVGQ
jgi:hypothetical protein